MVKQMSCPPAIAPFFPEWISAALQLTLPVGCLPVTIWQERAAQRQPNLTQMIPFTRRAQALHGERLLFADGWKERLVEAGIRGGGAWWQSSPGEVVRSSLMTNCFRVALEDGERVYFKRYDYAGVDLRRNRYFLRPSRAAVEAWGCEQLRQIGIPSLEVVSLGERREWGVLRAAFLVTRELPGAIDLESFMRGVGVQPAPEKRSRVIRRIAHELASQVGRAHACGFVHLDLHWRNILLQPQGEGYLPVWSDCPRAKYFRLRYRFRILKDLADLLRPALVELTPFARMRLMRIYLGAGYTKHRAVTLSRRLERYLER